jgi:type VI secretion system protein ImpK
MELQYLCVALGFKGKYQVQDRGDVRLAEAQQELYRTIRTHRGVPQPELSLQWQGVQDRRNRLIRYIPWWVVGAAAVAILGIAFAIYHTRLANRAAPVYAALGEIGTDDFAPRAAAPPVGPSLKQLLAPEEQAGALRVDEQGARTLVTLAGSNLFASASATPSGAAEALLTRVGQALEQVPGRVLVVGHTDNQPLRSLRYPNNFELSRERAVSVARILQRGTSNPARFQWDGKGASQPVATPETTAADRARNRRVEIVHLRE